MSQIKTRSVTWGSIVGSAAFRKGIEDFQAGRAPAFDETVVTRGGLWNYERGRLYAAACRARGRAPQPTRFGRRISQIAIRDFAEMYRVGDVI